jgi:hypothetical protein
MRAAASFDWPRFVTRPAAVWLVWGMCCVLALAWQLAIGFQPYGPDDFMRLLQVRDLLAGQSWWDVTQYRVDPPAGASMHWSRLVDIPLALLGLLAGETAALFLVPLLYLLAALFALRSILLRLELPSLAVGLGLVILPLFPLLISSFTPFRIDHHTPQAVFGLASAALLLQPGRVSATLSGLLAAAWVAISLEGLPMVVGFAGLYGLVYWLWDDRRLAPFLTALAIAAPVLSLATRPLSAFALPYCDILLPGHMAAFAAAALTAWLLPVLPQQQRRAGRLGALILIGVVSAPIAFFALGSCAGDPFGELDPLIRQYWHGQITEGLPIWQQPISVMAMLVWTPLLVIAACWPRKRAMLAAEERARVWLLYAGLTLCACLYSLALMREAIVAQLLAVPFAAALLAHYLPKARAVQASAPRIIATLACFLLATPSFVSGVLKPLDPLSPVAPELVVAVTPLEAQDCDFAQLASLPTALLFAPLDSGPEILAKTGNSVVAANYHRNQQRMAEVIAAHIGSVDAAQEIVRASRADYVVTCTSNADIAHYRSAGDGNFADAIASGEVPDWLEPVKGFSAAPLRVYRLR